MTWLAGFGCENLGICRYMAGGWISEEREEIYRICGEILEGMVRACVLDVFSV